MPTPSNPAAPDRAGNPWFAVTMGLLGLIAGYAIAGGLSGSSSVSAGDTTPPPAVAAGGTVPTPPPTTETPADADDDPFVGEADAPITLIEFTDYQCPFCGRHFTQTYSQIKAEYVDTGKVKYVTRDFPLGFHQNAQKAAEASECADDQGKFADMHDKLFAEQGAWSSAADAASVFKQYAADLGMNAGDFDSCLDGGTHAEEVRADMAAGQASGISGTPGFWILGPDGQNQLISGAYPYDTFKAAFDGMLQ